MPVCTRNSSTDSVSFALASFLRSPLKTLSVPTLLFSMPRPESASQAMCCAAMIGLPPLTVIVYAPSSTHPLMRPFSSVVGSMGLSSPSTAETTTGSTLSRCVMTTVAPTTGRDADLPSTTSCSVSTTNGIWMRLTSAIAYYPQGWAYLLVNVGDKHVRNAGDCSDQGDLLVLKTDDAFFLADQARHQILDGFDG